MVDHGGDDEVDVDPERVVEHKPDEGQQGEDIADWQPTGALGTVHDLTEMASVITEMRILCMTMNASSYLNLN